MKTQFKHHIKFGSCWYDNFFNVNTKSRVVISNEVEKRVKEPDNQKIIKANNPIHRNQVKKSDDSMAEKTKNHELKK